MATGRPPRAFAAPLSARISDRLTRIRKSPVLATGETPKIAGADDGGPIDLCRKARARVGDQCAMLRDVLQPLDLGQVAPLSLTPAKSVASDPTRHAKGQDGEEKPDCLLIAQHVITRPTLAKEARGPPRKRHRESPQAAGW